jgi:5-methylcytosine-specific restriction enzyme A
MRLLVLGFHKVPHKGDLTLFYTGELESLCAQCHNVQTGMVETHGYTNDIGVDGWPTDPRHPVYAHR